MLRPHLRLTIPLAISAALLSSPLYAHDDDEEVTAKAWTVAAPIETTASTTRVDQAQLQATGARSAEDYLRLIPGLLIVQHGSEGKGHQIYLRGFDAGHGSDVEVTLEGLPLNEPSNVHAHGYIDLNFIIPEAVFAIDAIKGPFDVRQGDFATAGSIQYRLGIPKARRGVSVLYQAGTTNRHRAVAIWAPKSLATPELLAIEATTDQGYGQARQARRASAIGQRRLHLGPGQHIDLLGAMYLSEFGMPGAIRLEDWRAGRVGFYDAYTDKGLGKSARALLSAKLTQQLNAHQRLTLHAWTQARSIDLREDFTGYLLDPVQGDLRQQAQTAWYSGLELGYQHRLRPWMRAEAALGWRATRLDAIERGVNQDLSDGPLRRDQHLERDQLYATLAIRASPLHWLAIEAGARLDGFDDDATDKLAAGQRAQTTQVVTSPRLTARVFPSQTLTLFASLGQGIRSPETRAQLIDAQAPEDMDLSPYRGGAAKVTTSNSAEVGANWSPWSALALRAATFGTWIDREAVYDHVSGVNLELNGTRRIGAELGATIKPWRWLNLGADLTLVDARFVESGNPVPSVPKTLGTAHIEATPYEGFVAGVQWMVLGPRTLAQGARAATAHVGNASVSYRWDHVELNLQIENLTGHQWRAGEYAFGSWWDQSRPRSGLPALHYVAGSPRQARLGLRAYF